MLVLFILNAVVMAQDSGRHHHHHQHHHKHGHNKHHHKHGHKHPTMAVNANTSNMTLLPSKDIGVPSKLFKANVTPAVPNTVPSHMVVSSAVNASVVAMPNIGKTASKVATQQDEQHMIVSKMKKLEAELVGKNEQIQAMTSTRKGEIEVNSPVPVDFEERFVQAVAHATECNPTDVKVVSITNAGNVEQVMFEGPKDVIKAIENQAADPDSRLANGPMRSFLLARDDNVDTTHTHTQTAEANVEASGPVQEKGIDIDTEMPYGDLEPFGREDTAQELTESSVKESDEMVDQLERAEVAEEKRAVFRALTRLRGAAITSFDGVARSQTGNIDEYNKVHQWRQTHPLHHLADEESDITKWAFPDNAD